MAVVKFKQIIISFHFIETHRLRWFNYTMTKKNNQKSKTKKATQQKRFRNLMYAEAVGCLPLKWLDKRYLLEYNKDVMVLKNSMQEPLEHKDGTPVTFHPHAILDMNAIEEDLNNAFGSDDDVLWAVILHDKEFAQDGVTRPHIHIAIHFKKSPKTFSAVRKLLGLYDETKDNFIRKFEGKYAKQSMFSYLPHLTNEATDDKINYEDYLNKPSKFRANFDCKKLIRVAQDDVKSKEYDVSTIIDDILNRDLIEYDIYSDKENNAFAKFYLNNKTKVDNALKMANRQVIAKGKRGEEPLLIFYIQGGPGQGKTQTALNIAKKQFKHYYVSGAGNDPVQDYMGQECFILDDARPTDFEASDWLKLLDPYNTVPAVKSRYFNKAMPVKCIMITTTTPFEEFFVYAKGKGAVADEPLGQFIRRFTAVIDVSKDVESLLRDRNEGIKTYTTPEYPYNFKLAPENRSQDCIENRLSDKYFDEQSSLKAFEHKYNIEQIKHDYDGYTVGRVYSVEQTKPNQHTTLQMNLKEDYSVKRKSFKIDRCLKEQDRFIITPLKNENNSAKVEDFLQALTI